MKTNLTPAQIRAAAEVMDSTIHLMLNQIDGLRHQQYPKIANQLQKKIPKIERLIATFKAAAP